VRVGLPPENVVTLIDINGCGREVPRGYRRRTGVLVRYVMLRRSGIEVRVAALGGRPRLSRIAKWLRMIEYFR